MVLAILSSRASSENQVMLPKLSLATLAEWLLGCMCLMCTQKPGETNGGGQSKRLGSSTQGGWWWSSEGFLEAVPGRRGRGSFQVGGANLWWLVVLVLLECLFRGHQGEGETRGGTGKEERKGQGPQMCVKAGLWGK